jgi:hypothetical protein
MSGARKKLAEWLAGWLLPFSVHIPSPHGCYQVKKKISVFSFLLLLTSCYPTRAGKRKRKIDSM